jgi:hypothetical protein
MMRAGKDYVGATPEYEDKRSAHLLELLRTIKAQSEPPEASDEPAPDAAAKTNQDKPTIKMK